MDDVFVGKMKAKLEAERDLLRGELEKIADKDEKVEGDYDTKMPQYGNDVEDNEKEREQYERNLAIEQELEVKLVDVEDALKRVDAGKYGACEECGGDIDEARLEALPSARHCMSCENKA